MQAIKYLTYGQIDKTKWDACINNATNGLVYGYSIYLDSMAKNWDALVLNDYEAVMPLTWNKKYSIRYLYQPPFTACLGIFGNMLTAEMINDFLKAIPPKFKYWDIYLNPGNFFSLADFTLYERMNYVLPLNAPYESLQDNYRDNIKRNIKKAEKLNLVINKNIAVAEVILLVREQARDFAAFAAKDFEHFKILYQLLYKKEKATTYGVYTKEGQLMAAAVFFFSHNRAYYIMVGNHPNGKTLGASHTLIDAFIKDHSGQNLLLDFEGSDIHSLAHFYSSFGAREEKYSAIKLNRLPAPFKWFKK
ncbi:MAG: GNAT family N-acetyltransferase [Chitinophagaceae bacterium]|nr:GNAT family N-acetyltransferase [Chitinophagaceae bacterium]